MEFLHFLLTVFFYIFQFSDLLLLLQLFTGPAPEASQKLKHLRLALFLVPRKM